jgi:hypothetical protein
MLPGIRYAVTEHTESGLVDDEIRRLVDAIQELTDRINGL